MIKDKSTKNVSCASHICGILSCSLWLLYGILKDDWSIKLVNAFGSVCFSFYIIVYYIYTVKKVSNFENIDQIRVWVTSFKIFPNGFISTFRILFLSPVVDIVNNNTDSQNNNFFFKFSEKILKYRFFRYYFSLN